MDVVVATWTGELARILRAAWRMTVEEFAAELGVTPRVISKWEGDPTFIPPASMQRVLDTALEQRMPEHARARFQLLRNSSIPSNARNAQDANQASLSFELVETALRKGDGVEYAAQEAAAEQLDLLSGPTTEATAVLWDEICEIARSTSRSPREAFSATRRVRYQAARLAEKTRRPGVLADLYVIAGQATALMASTAFDLNQWNAAASLARSALSCGELGGSPSLEAWALGLAATLANWRYEPDAALNHFQRGLEIAPAGASRARLRYIAARSLALMGDHSGVAEVLERARRDQDDAENAHDMLNDQVGGEFAFGRARADACAAAAWLDLGDGLEAKHAAQGALAELTSVPQSRQPLSQVAGARIDLATACLLQHDLDEAEETLKVVFSAPSALRNVSLSGRLTRARKVLTLEYPLIGGAARSLDEAIGGWLSDRAW